MIRANIKDYRENEQKAWDINDLSKVFIFET